MFAGGCLLGGTLLFFAVWLQWTEHRGWPHDTFDGEEDREYRAKRRKSRLLVNVLIGICGLLILTSTFADHRVVFVAAWSIVSLILMVVIVLAGLDAFRTHRHQRDKLRRMREQAMEE